MAASKLNFLVALTVAYLEFPLVSSAENRFPLHLGSIGVFRLTSLKSNFALNLFFSSRKYSSRRFVLCRSFAALSMVYRSPKLVF